MLTIATNGDKEKGKDNNDDGLAHALIGLHFGAPALASESHPKAAYITDRMRTIDTGVSSCPPRTSVPVSENNRRKTKTKREPTNQPIENIARPLRGVT